MYDVEIIDDIIEKVNNGELELDAITQDAVYEMEMRSDEISEAAGKKREYFSKNYNKYSGAYPEIHKKRLADAYFNQVFRLLFATVVLSAIICYIYPDITYGLLERTLLAIHVVFFGCIAIAFLFLLARYDVELSEQPFVSNDKK